jgi:hypothetical protein
MSIGADSDDDNSAHPVLGLPDTAAYGLLHYLGDPFPMRFQVTNDVDFDLTHRFVAMAARDTVYRIELHFERTGDATATLDARIHDAGGTRLWDAATLPCEWHGNAHTMAELAMVEYASAAAMDGLGGMRIAHEGGPWGPFPEPNATYYGGVAVSGVDWPGPYVPGEATPP